MREKKDQAGCIELLRTIDEIGFAPVIVIMENLREGVEAMLRTMTPREEDVIRRRFGMDSYGQTRSEIGIDLGVTRERIRQIQTKALRKLRHPSRRRRLMKTAAEIIGEANATHVAALQEGCLSE